MEAIGQFELLELIEKNRTGSTYRARDVKSGQTVTLRKFTPFESEKRELNTEEQVAYRVAIERLSEIRHPSLRTVIAGGCDPNDSMPYVVSNWSEAVPLNVAIKQKDLTAQQITTLLNQALELCDILSHILNEDGVWIETDIDTIGFMKSEAPSDYLFWVSPAKFLNGRSKDNCLDAIASLTEELCRQSGILEDDPSSSYITTWLKWMKGTAGARSSIHETREILAASAGIEPPAPVESLVEKARSHQGLLRRLPSLPRNKLKRPKKPLFVLLCMLLFVEAIIGYMWVQYIHSSSQEEIQQINLNIEQVTEDFLEMDDSKQ